MRSMRGYGALWPEEGRDLSYYVQLAKNVGFEIVSRRESDQMIFLELRNVQSHVR